MTSPPALDRWLTLAARDLPAGSGAALAPWMPLARAIPGTCLAALEERLDGHLGGRPDAPPGADGARFDLSFRLHTPQEARALVASAGPGSSWPLLRPWSASSLLRRRLPALWLELDAARRTVGSPAPLAITRLGPDAGPTWISAELLPALLGRLPTPAQRRRLDRALALAEGLAGDGVVIDYLFDLSPRGSATVRLELRAPRLDPLAAVLEGLAGADAVDAQGPALFEASGAVLGVLDRYHLAMDFPPRGPGRRLGVSGSCRRPPERDGRWEELAGRLVAAGLGSERRLRELLDWPGVDSCWSRPDEWPVAPGTLAGRLVRSLSHVKLVAAPGEGLRAKAYRLVGWVATVDR